MNTREWLTKLVWDTLGERVILQRGNRLWVCALENKPFLADCPADDTRHNTEEMRALLLRANAIVGDPVRPGVSLTCHYPLWAPWEWHGYTVVSQRPA